MTQLLSRVPASPSPFRAITALLFFCVWRLFLGLSVYRPLLLLHFIVFPLPRFKYLLPPAPSIDSIYLLLTTPTPQPSPPSPVPLGSHSHPASHLTHRFRGEDEHSISHPSSDEQPRPFAAFFPRSSQFKHQELQGQVCYIEVCLHVCVCV